MAGHVPECVGPVGKSDPVAAIGGSLDRPEKSLEEYLGLLFSDDEPPGAGTNVSSVASNTYSSGA